MEIILDCDGVVLDWLQFLLATLGNPLKPEEVTTVDVLSVLDEQKRWEALHLLDQVDWWASIPPMDRALEGLEVLLTAGHSILWATSPWITCLGWETMRRHQITTWFRSPHDSILMGAPKERIDGDVFLDDKPEHVSKWSIRHSGKIARLYRQPYNAGTRHTRIDWTDIIESGGRFRFK